MLEVLQELKANYGTTLLLTTATQPSLHSRPLGTSTFQGLEPQPLEIVPSSEMPELFGSLRRVAVYWPDGNANETWDSLAGKIAGHPQVLAIVDKRKDAVALWKVTSRR
jgi:hypothetical protein